MSGLFRCAGDILFDDNEPLPGQISNVQLKKFSETSNFLQYLQPLTPEHPYFFAQIKALAQQSKITIGIAGPDIDNDAHPGHWNNTVGYHSDTGKCFTSHIDTANTKGEKFTIGDMFGVLVTYFGDQMSTVMFLKNGHPVATRYLFESDHKKFFPTICLENGPIDLGIMWPEAAVVVPRFDEKDMLNWIRDPSMNYDLMRNEFCYNKKLTEVCVQSPQPLTRDMVHYEVVIQEAINGESPAVGIATCSPLKPSPTCSLLRDYFRWKADGKAIITKPGEHIGFGIHYNPDVVSKPEFCDRDQQLVLCFVTLDMQIIFFKIMIQPPGGFYPLVVLCKNASKVKIDVETNRTVGDDETTALLDKLFREKYEEAMSIFMEDFMKRELKIDMFRKSQDIQVDPGDSAVKVTLPASKKRIHVIQFKQSLTPTNHYYCMEIVKLNEDSVVSIGVADSSFPLSKHPGKLKRSTGWVSRDGKMYFNEKCSGNIEGERFNEGDTIGVTVQTFHPELSVVLFIKNDRPVGTRFLSIKDSDQFFPTIALCGNGYDVELHVYYQNRISTPPIFRISDLNHWCKPEDCIVSPEGNVLAVKEHLKPIVLQCPYSFNDMFNHFEIELIDSFGEKADGRPPPVVALTAACSQEYWGEESHFKLDYLRFWATGEAEQSVSVGDLTGWGMLVPPSEEGKDKDRLIICYLTINRNVVLTRVMYEPPGGLYPIVLLPSDVNRVKLEFSALRILSHPMTDSVINKILADAKEIIMQEKEVLASGRDLDELQIDKSLLLRPLPQESRDPDGGSAGSSTLNARMANVVIQAKGVNSVQRAISTYKEGRASSASGSQSKACNIL